MRAWMRCCCLGLWLCLSSLSAQAEEGLGVVLLHGKESRPDTPQMTRLAGRLRDAGYLVRAPEMPWSRRRIYDADVDAAMAEIAREAQALRAQGAARIVVIGHSQGANAALRFAATQPVDAIVLLAPGHNPEALYRQLRADVQRARQMVSEGRGEEVAEFGDVNVSHTLRVRTSARIYLSWLDPEGAAVMARNAERMPRAIPIFLAVGSRDPVTRSRAELFDKAPPHAASVYLSVEADHINVPEAASEALLVWLKAL